MSYELIILVILALQPTPYICECSVTVVTKSIVPSAPCSSGNLCVGSAWPVIS